MTELTTLAKVQALVDAYSLDHLAELEPGLVTDINDMTREFGTPWRYMLDPGPRDEPMRLSASMGAMAESGEGFARFLTEHADAIDRAYVWMLNSIADYKAERGAAKAELPPRPPKPYQLADDVEPNREAEADIGEQSLDDPDDTSTLQGNSSPD